jgi:hypothetical protein
MSEAPLEGTIDPFRKDEIIADFLGDMLEREPQILDGFNKEIDAALKAGGANSETAFSVYDRALQEVEGVKTQLRLCLDDMMRKGGLQDGGRGMMIVMQDIKRWTLSRAGYWSGQGSPSDYKTHRNYTG